MSVAVVSEPARQSRLAMVLRHRYLLLAAASTVLVLLTASDRGFDLVLLVEGAKVLAGHGASYFGVVHGPSAGLHFYAAVPGVQVGPLALGYVLALDTWCGDAGHVACLIATMLGLVAIACVERAGAAPLSDRAKVMTLVGGLAVCVSWADTVQRWGHVEDALVAVAAAGAVLALRRERTALAGLLIGLAIASKPTALPLVTLLVTGPGAALFSRSRVRAVVIAGALTAAAYLPFVVADSATMRAATPQLDVQPASVIALLGAPVGVTPSSLLRLLQLVVALGLGLWAVRRNGALAGLLAVSAGRLLLDPGAYSYYALPLVLAAAGMAIDRRRWPVLAWFTLLTMVVLPWVYPTRQHWESLLTATVCIAAVVTAVAPIRWRLGVRSHAPRPLESGLSQNLPA